MDRKKIIETLKDYRVAAYVVLIIISLIVIFPHPSDGTIKTNLQYGLDLEGGSWINLPAEHCERLSRKVQPKLAIQLRLCCMQL